MFYVQNGQGYVCSGTLINDKAGSGTPYFLTANHCISTQTVASTLETSWFYRTPSCNSRTLSSASRTGCATAPPCCTPPPPMTAACCGSTKPPLQAPSLPAGPPRP
ncbi:hypothetical protein [Delftia sp.]|uniref:hypothetical protein n=1 Tax=Delftia sp. TaxID=1886637 RepID=UPI00259CA132|nr:hypothetical protein [Delftia sp.]